MTAGAQATAVLPKTGVLRFERDGDALTGDAFITAENGEMTLHFADGASIYLTAA
jgi:hypothetical protein